MTLKKRLKMYKYKTLTIFFLILILAIFLRTQNLDKPLQRDEMVFFETAKNLDKQKIPIYCKYCLDEHGQFFKINDWHSPLFLIFLSQIIHFFDLNEFIIRLSITVFSIATVILMYFIGNEISGEKLGLFSMFLLSINRLHVEHSQIVDIDGSFFTFFITLTILFFLKWQNSKKRYKILFIFALILSLLTKEPTILLFPALFFYFYKKRKTHEFFEFTIITLSIFLVVLFSLSFIYSTDFFDGIFRVTTNFGIQRVTLNITQRLYQFTGTITWEFTLPFILLFIFSIFYEIKTKNLFCKFLIYIVFPFFIFYTLILGINRYFIPIIPILCLFSSNYILDKKIISKLENILIILFVGILCFITFYLLKVRTDIYFLTNITTNFSIIMVPYILCLIPLFLYFTNHKNLAFSVLLGMIIGYNIFFSQEAVNPLISPDYSRSVIEAAKFIEKSSIESPIITNSDIAFYSSRYYYNIQYPFVTATFIKNLVEKNKVHYVIYRADSLLIPAAVEEFLKQNCKKIENEIFKAFKC